MIEPIDLIVIVLGLAVLVGCINHLWIGLPPTIGMLLGSLFISLLIVSSDHVFHLHIMRWFRATFDSAHLPNVFLDGVLALLLFAGSLHADVLELSQRRWTILFLATASVILSTLVFGASLWAVSNLIGASVPPAWCFVLGAILAPTDAVAVDNLLRQTALSPELRAAMVGESLFNDGAGVVLFLLALGVTQGETVVLGHGTVMLALLREIIGGIGFGLVAGWLAALLIRRVRDEGLQLLISLTLALGCYRVAIAVDLSGPISVVTAGLCMASRSPRLGMGDTARVALAGFWSLLDQILNTILFLLIGLQLLGLYLPTIGLLPFVFAIPLAVFSRFISVAVPLSLTREPASNKVRDIAILTWAGLRGGISIALALTLPVTPWRGELLMATYMVVIFTIVVQGLTIPRLLRAVHRSEKLQ
jgi:CPA1 family monovalent cation:H+ antiporter